MTVRVLGHVNRLERILGSVSSTESLASQTPERLRLDTWSRRRLRKKIVERYGAAERPADRNTRDFP